MKGYTKAQHFFSYILDCEPADFKAFRINRDDVISRSSPQFISEQRQAYKRSISNSDCSHTFQAFTSCKVHNRLKKVSLPIAINLLHLLIFCKPPCCHLIDQHKVYFRLLSWASLMTSWVSWLHISLDEGTLFHTHISWKWECKIKWQHKKISCFIALKCCRLNWWLGSLKNFETLFTRNWQRLSVLHLQWLPNWTFFLRVIILFAPPCFHILQQYLMILQKHNHDSKHSLSP